MNSPPLEVKVWGSLACFTRPEFGTERVSYEVMTPSAARGILEAIFWKPEFSWQVREIAVLPPVMRSLDGKPIGNPDRGTIYRHLSIIRNEVNKVQTLDWAESGEPYFADDDRAQRHTLALRDVAYIIKAHIELKPHAISDGVHINKYIEQFQKRVKNGCCFYQPYFGTREFAAFFGLPDEEKPISANVKLGLMLNDIEFSTSDTGKLKYLNHDSTGTKVVEGNASPQFFEAELLDGILKVPARR